MSDEGADEQEEEEVDHHGRSTSRSRGRGGLSVVWVCRQRVVGWECVCGGGRGGDVCGDAEV